MIDFPVRFDDGPDPEPMKVVIERRGMPDLVWSTDEGLVSITMLPNGVVGVFEGKEVLSMLVSWYEVSTFAVYDLDYEEPQSGPITPCVLCKATGLVDEGALRCPECDGFGHA